MGTWMSFHLNASDKKFPLKLMKEFLPDLLQMSRERNVVMRSSCESAIITMFAMHIHGSSVLNDYADKYSGKDTAALQDLYQSKLKKGRARPTTSRNAKKLTN